MCNWYLLVVTVINPYIDQQPVNDSASVLALQSANNTLASAHSILTAIKSVKDAQAAKPKLAALGKSFEESAKTIQELPELSSKAVEEQHVANRELLQKLNADYARLASTHDVLMEIAAHFPIPLLDRRKNELAAIETRTLITKLQSYKTVFGVWPLKLADLTRSDQAGLRPLREKELVDPWGRQYQYDAAAAFDATKVPRIWSLGPLHGQLVR